ncbi:MAG: hypothetical protein E6Q36_03560 [Chryseobacterium sp.]|jgi:hypothetical protein|nr:MAG: hypothetical protein E6Q36_03560 [Chryseobacterium sp.]
MSPEMLSAIGVIIIVVLFVLLFLLRRLPKKVKTKYYVRKWREIQRLCGDKEEWPHAIVHADMLLDEVLRKRRISGKTMGERLVNAQNRFSAHDALWTAHKFANSIRQENSSSTKITEGMVKDALIAFRQALRDLGAL